MRGRVDLEKYRAACECLHNYLVLPQGGATRRPGTRFVAEVKSSTAGCVRLLRLEPTASKGYVFELGDQYLRIFTNNAAVLSGGSAVEVTTPYAIADVFGIDAVPSVDVLYLLHPNYQTRKLERYSDTVWKLRTVPFTPPPSLEFGLRPIADVQPDAVSGENVTLTATGCDAFLASDVGREVLITGGVSAGARAGVKSITTARIAVASVCVAFADTAVIASKLWKITASPRTGVTPGAKTPVGLSTTLTADAAAWRGGVNGYGIVESDCGRFVVLNGGSFEITAVTSATAATATIRGDASATTKAEADNWTLEEALFSTCNGWAETGGFHESRLYLAAKHRFAGSKSGDYENFAVGTLADDAVIFAMDSEQLELIRWLHGRKKGLLIGTLSREWEAIGSTDAPITADNIQVGDETSYGSSGVPPLFVGNAVLFVARSGRQLHELAFVFEADGFQAPDLLLLAEHLTRRSTASGIDPTIIDLAYQRAPEPRIWAVRSDGVLLSCAYLREQNIIAWSRCTTNGFVESMAVIHHPNGGRDQVWAAVRRTINGATKRYIEYFDDDGLSYPTLNVDAAYTCNSATAIATFVGLGHLEGATVRVVADGSVRPDATVSSGNITIASPCAKKVEIGLNYTSDLITMRPEVPVGGQSSMPAKLGWRRLGILLLDTLGMTLGTASGEEIVPFRTAADCMGFAPAFFSGYKEIPHLGWDDGKVIIRQTQPLPSTVVAITGILDLGGA